MNAVKSPTEIAPVQTVFEVAAPVEAVAASQNCRLPLPLAV